LHENNADVFFRCILRLVCCQLPVSNSLSRDARPSRPVQPTQRGASRPAATSKYPAKRDSANNCFPQNVTQSRLRRSLPLQYANYADRAHSVNQRSDVRVLNNVNSVNQTPAVHHSQNKTRENAKHSKTKFEFIMSPRTAYCSLDVHYN